MEPLLPAATPRRGGRWRDHRLVIDGVAFNYRTGTPWTDLPELFGSWKGIHKRLRNWPITAPGRTSSTRYSRGPMPSDRSAESEPALQRCREALEAGASLGVRLSNRTAAQQYRINVPVCPPL
ncbi:transposase [Streptomyces sp. NPDC048568]|uniref:transposase n=1 Tax=Streptomyces sp. NPDC048568 TaxID=3365571 RepID=UPI0037139D5D